VGVKRKCCERHQFDAPDPTATPTRIPHGREMQTAKTLGLEVPPTLLARADEVIE